MLNIIHVGVNNICGLWLDIVNPDSDKQYTAMLT